MQILTSVNFVIVSLDINTDILYTFKKLMSVRNILICPEFISELHILGERKLQCEICGKKFFTFGDIRKHKDMTHLKRRPYTCKYCLKGYSSRHALKTHIRQHTKETPFKCEVCAEGFRQKVSLKLI